MGTSGSLWQQVRRGGGRVQGGRCSPPGQKGVFCPFRVLGEHNPFHSRGAILSPIVPSQQARHLLFPDGVGASQFSWLLVQGNQKR